MKIFIPSINRARSVFALEVFPGATLVVPESQRADYGRCNPGATVLAVPDAEDGNLAKKRNAIAAMGRTEPDGAFIVVDDDLCGLWDKQAKRKIVGVEAAAMLESLVARAAQEGAVFFGIAPAHSQNPQGANEWTTDGMFFQIYGFRGDAIPPFDEGISGFESTDMFFQCRERGLKTLRWECYGVEVIKGNLGGLDRVKTKCLAASEALARKWGLRVVKLTPNGVVCGLNLSGVKCLV